jgi:hypothetical protein
VSTRAPDPVPKRPTESTLGRVTRVQQSAVEVDRNRTGGDGAGMRGEDIDEAVEPDPRQRTQFGDPGRGEVELVHGEQLLGPGQIVGGERGQGRRQVCSAGR